MADVAIVIRTPKKNLVLFQVLISTNLELHEKKHSKIVTDGRKLESRSKHRDMSLIAYIAFIRGLNRGDKSRLSL